MKVFFSHAGEDTPIVDQIYVRIMAKYPDIAGWMDKYEIVGGNDLIDKLAQGMDTSDRFLVFLSDISVRKPWVQAELKRAFMKEISGINPDYIIPVKLGAVKAYPPFLESKIYIDISELTENEMLEEIHSAILGVQTRQPGPIQDNVIHKILPVDGETHAVMVALEAKYFAAEVSHVVVTAAKIAKGGFDFPAIKGIRQVSVVEKLEQTEYAVKIIGERLRPGNPFVFIIWFEDKVQGSLQVVEVRQWDGTGGQDRAAFMNFGQLVDCKPKP